MHTCRQLKLHSVKHFVTRARPSRPAPIFDRASRWGGGQCVQWLVRPSFGLKSIAGRENNTQMKAWNPTCAYLAGWQPFIPSGARDLTIEVLNTQISLRDRSSL